MKVHRIQAHASATNAFAVECPDCHQSKEYATPDLPPNFKNPFSFDYGCPCGAVLSITLDRRAGHRKRVNLVGSFTLRSTAKKDPVFFDIVDLSATGMQIVADDAAKISNGQRFDATIILDDRQRTKLILPCIVRRKSSSERRLLLGLEFEQLALYQQQALGSYLMV